MTSANRQFLGKAGRLVRSRAGVVILLSSCQLADNVGPAGSTQFSVSSTATAGTVLVVPVTITDSSGFFIDTVSSENFVLRSNTGSLVAKSISKFTADLSTLRTVFVIQVTFEVTAGLNGDFSLHFAADADQISDRYGNFVEVSTPIEGGTNIVKIVTSPPQVLAESTLIAPSTKELVVTIKSFFNPIKQGQISGADFQIVRVGVDDPKEGDLLTFTASTATTTDELTWTITLTLTAEDTDNGVYHLRITDDAGGIIDSLGHKLDSGTATDSKNSDAPFELTVDGAAPTIEVASMVFNPASEVSYLLMTIEDSVGLDLATIDLSRFSFLAVDSQQTHTLTVSKVPHTPYKQRESTEKGSNTIKAFMIFKFEKQDVEEAIKATTEPFTITHVTPTTTTTITSTATDSSATDDSSSAKDSSTDDTSGGVTTSTKVTTKPGISDTNGNELPAGPIAATGLSSPAKISFDSDVPYVKTGQLPSSLLVNKGQKKTHTFGITIVDKDLDIDTIASEDFAFVAVELNAEPITIKSLTTKSVTNTDTTETDTVVSLTAEISNPEGAQHSYMLVIVGDITDAKGNKLAKTIIDTPLLITVSAQAALTTPVDLQDYFEQISDLTGSDADLVYLNVD